MDPINPLKYEHPYVLVKDVDDLVLDFFSLDLL
jgi:hypothetical protein